MTSEEYIIKRIEKLEEELEEKNEEIEELERKNEVLKMSEKQEREIRKRIKEYLNPRVSRVSDKSEAFVCEYVFSDLKDGKKQIEELCRWFGLEVEK